MLRAKGEEEQMGAVGWAGQVSAALLAPVVSHVVPMLHCAGYHQAAGPIVTLLGFV